MDASPGRLDSYNPALTDAGLRSARAVVPLILSLARPTSVIDLGCGPGNWLLALRELGVDDIHGVDQNDYGQDLRIPRECFAVANLAEPFQRERTFDLVICMEVAEHLPSSGAPTLVHSLTALGPIILFSAAIPFQGGTDHRNEQWPEYWQALFAEDDFVPVDCLRPRVWDDPQVAWWYAQNMLLYVHRPHLAAHPRLRAEAEHPPTYPLRVVHPAVYTKNMKAQAPARRHGLTGRIASALGRIRHRVIPDHR